MAGASASAIKGGEAFVSLLLNDTLFKTGLSKASADFKAWGKGLAAIGGAALGVGGAILAPITAGLTDFLSYASEVRGVAARLGDTVENISALGYAASTAGLDFEGMEHGLKHLQKTMFEARDGSAEATEHLAKLGITAEHFGDPISENARRASEGFKKLGDSTDKTGIAMKTMGRGGTEMIQFLSKGREEMDRLADRGGELGAILSTEDVAAAKKFTLSLKELAAATRFAFMALGKALIPAFGGMEEGHLKLTEMIISVRQWIAANGSVVIVAFAAGSALVAFGTAVAGAGAALIATGASITAFTTVMGVLASPPGVATAAIIGLGGAVVYFASQTDTGKKAIADMAEGFGLLKARVLEAWQGISDALQAGNWGLAVRIGWLEIQAEFTRGIQALHNIWGDFTDNFKMGWAVLGNFFALSWQAAVNEFQAGLDVLVPEWESWLAGFQTGCKMMSVGWNAYVDDFDRGLNKLKVGWGVWMKELEAGALVVGGMSYEEAGRKVNTPQTSPAAAAAPAALSRADADAKAKSDKRNAELKKLYDEQEAKLKKMHDEQEDRRNKRNADYEGKKENLGKEITDAIGEAKEAAYWANFERQSKELFGNMPGAPNIEQAMAGATRGAFAGSGSLAGMLSFGPTGDRVAKATEATADNTAQLLDKMGSDGPKFA